MQDSAESDSSLIHNLCDAFEKDWKAGQTPLIEDGLSDVNADQRPKLLIELLKLEIHYRKQKGEEPCRSDYVSRFPGQHAALDAVFGEEEQPNHQEGAQGKLTASGSSPANLSAPETIPERIDKYRIDAVLGEGGFGRVYKAYDEELMRPVAIKVPRKDRVSRPEDVEAYLREAQTVVQLDHPRIVEVYEARRTQDGLCFVVSRFLSGGDLATRIKQNRPEFRVASDWICQLAEALHFAHRQRIVHRDIKPANILLDEEGQVYLADFGLALREEDFGRRAGTAGTPVYMSPEQARGEGHRVDGRSDIFSLGVVFYELLTGRRPFRGNRKEILDQIKHVNACPPRQLVDTIPHELERICLKSLARRAVDRYTTANDLAEDLRHWLFSLQPQPVLVNSPQPVKVVPKGLRSFDDKDADFFLELLPGPRDREGLPESLRFWKQRIETTDPDEEAFSVGLICGPSGCGKSSMVKAELLPRLASNVVSVYIEATPDETETRLRKALIHGTDTQGSLVEMLTNLRLERGLRSGQKVLIVLDQFEQWLHAHREETDTELVEALRQCDGVQLQCVVMVRDDFWMAVMRFMEVLEVNLDQIRNMAKVDLFDMLHAKKVLALFGHAFGRLPAKTSDFSNDQEMFLDKAVSDLAHEGRVISVQLALFADMVKGKEWIPATLEEIGGATRVAVTFLEEAFSSSTAPPTHRLHQRAARNVLRALLPESASDIKGHMRSHQELLKASDYGNRPKQFADLLRILDQELRLITPTQLVDEDADGLIEVSGQFYQLTHDYLVPSLREWLTKKQKETPEGRAELLLEECVALWTTGTVKPLPTLQQWGEIHSLTTKEKWTQLQQRMMDAANQNHLLSVRDRLLDANTVDVPKILKDIGEYRGWVGDGMLQQVFCQADSHANPRQQLHASLALLLVDETQIEFLYERLLAADLHEVPAILNALTPHKNELLDTLWSVLESTLSGNGPQRLRAAAALAKYDSDCEKWVECGALVVADLVRENPIFLGQWSALFRPVTPSLLSPLSEIFRDRNSERATERSLATTLLADYAADSPQVLADLLLDADEKQFAIIYPKL